MEQSSKKFRLAGLTVEALAIMALSASIFASCSLLPQATPKALNQSTQGTITAQKQLTWLPVKPGLDFSNIEISNTEKPGTSTLNLQLVKIDPSQYSFSIYQNKSEKDALSIREVGQKEKAILTFNGQFFTEDFNPTGLLIDHNLNNKKLSHASIMEGIFTIDRNNLPQLFTTSQLEERTNNPGASKITFAIQNGPVLLAPDGQIQIEKDSGQKASRTAIGISSDNHIILIFIKQSLLNNQNSISLYRFAHLLKENPEIAKLGLHSVLNLDGGPSTGFMLKQDYYPEFEKVQNIVVVKPK